MPVELRRREIVDKALGFLRTRLEKPVRMAEVAECVACSPSHLRAIFRSATGRSILRNLQELRLEKARTLLLQTSLTVTEVMYAVGFRNPSSFGRLFRRATGASPGRFRQSLQTGPEPRDAPRAAGVRPMLQESFAGALIPDGWRPLSGTWRAAGGCLEGRGDPHLQLDLKAELPENFRVELELQTRPDAAWDATSVHVGLHAPDLGSYCSLRLPVSPQEPGGLVVRNRYVLWNTEAFLSPNVWHTVQFELRDNRIAAALDGKPVCSFRDLFPPAYTSRCRLGIYSRRPLVRIRRFRLFDLGQPAVVPAVRQGDTLFASGQFEQARTFYLRHLDAHHSADEAMELRFKAGVCLFRMGRLAECRDWVQSILPLARTPAWHRECDLLLLQLDAESATLEEFTRHLRASLRDPAQRDGARPLLAARFERLEKSGFLEEALQLGRLWMSVEQKSPMTALLAREPVAKVLKKLKRSEEAARLFRPLCHAPFPAVARFAGLVSLFDVATLQGRIDKARAVQRRMQRLYAGHPDAPLCVIQEAICLRAERRIPAAIRLLRQELAADPNERGYRLMLEHALAELLACAGDLAGAETFVNLLRAGEAGHVSQSPPLRSALTLHGLLRRQHARTAAWLLEGARLETPDLFARGQMAVTAGILLELAGRKQAALDVWRETSRRFPPEYCYFWGGFARELAANRLPPIEALQHYFHVRSEMFFLTGLLEEHRGHAARARELLALAVREDPTRLWPAQLAERKLKPTS
jgi:AraC-like DNA-binding protein/tetratricopeptide (TPR) repeat protein